MILLPFPKVIRFTDIVMLPVIAIDVELIASHFCASAPDGKALGVRLAEVRKTAHMAVIMAAGFRISDQSGFL